MQQTLVNLILKGAECMVCSRNNQPALRNMLPSTQHLEKYYYFVQDYIGREVQLYYVQAEDMLADIMTKSLGRTAHERFRYQLLTKFKEGERSPNYKGYVKYNPKIQG